MAFSLTLSDTQWGLVAGLFDPPGRRGAPAQIPRRQMVDAMLFLARTGCQWRYLPEHFGAWSAVWSQWRRWRANGVWEEAMARLAQHIRMVHERDPLPSMVLIDAQTVKGGRYGPTFHQAGGRGGRTIGTKRSILVDILGLPVAAHVDSARPHDVRAGREMRTIRRCPTCRASMRCFGDRGYRALEKATEHHHTRLERLDSRANPAYRRTWRREALTRGSVPGRPTPR